MTALLVGGQVAGPAAARGDRDRARDVVSRIEHSTPLATQDVSAASRSSLEGAAVHDDRFGLARRDPGRPLGHVGDSQAVYSSGDGDTVIQRTTSGGRILEVINSSDAPVRFVYDLTVPVGSEIIADPGGTDFLIGRKTQGADGTTTFEVEQMILPAWAIDDVGRSLPATYSLNGTVLTMAVDTTGAVFPVVADPTWTGGGFQVYYTGLVPTGAIVSLNKARTDDAMDGNIVGCGIFLVIPVIGGYLAASCAVWGWLMKTTVRIAGYCARYAVSFFNPTKPTLSFYRGGFCT